MKKKIILATVNAKKENYAATADEFSAIAPNVQMGLLASYLKSKNIDLEVIDSEVESLSHKGLIEIIEKEEPLLFGLICSGANPSSSTMTLAGIVDFFEKYSPSGLATSTFVWGSHPTVLPERTLKETGTDFVIRGEGYETIRELFFALSSNKKVNEIAGLSYMGSNNGKTIYIENKDSELINNLDSLPMLDWGMMNPAKYKAHNWHCFGEINDRSPYAILWTSFGCPFKCNFCSINNLFGKRTQRFRSIDCVINEISLLVEKYHVRHIKILDELFVTHPRRIEEFCDRLEEKAYNLNMWSYSRVDTINRHLLKRLKRVGMNWISYGFETASEEVLNTLQKGKKGDYDTVIRMTRDEGINICADVMFGLPDDNMETMNKTYDFLEEYNFEWVNMYPVYAYPGTVLFDNIENPGSWKNYSLYGYESVPAGTKHLTSGEVLRFRDEAFIRYHGSRKYLEMIENKFGTETKEHIMRMVKVPLKRKLLENNK